nr:unnamed protein product [Callosobruchus chinensis]
MDDLDVALLVVLDGEDSEEEKHRRSESDLFKKRSIEGAYQILICRHLYTNENKLREYFRLTPALFDYVLGYIKEDLCSKPTNRVQNPLTPEQKLCLLLRYVNILPTSTNNTEKYQLPTLNLLPLSQNNVRGANTAIQTGETFKTYFNGPGAVAWQEQQYREN